MISNELTKRIMSSIILLPLVFFFIIKGSYYLNIFLILCLFISAFEWSKITKVNRDKLLGILFLVTSFFTIYKIRNSLNGEYFYLLFITLICIATDIGGFLFGKFIKGPKLTKLSPNKTFSGMIGSFILTIVIIYLFSKNIHPKFSYNLTSEIIFFSIMVSAISQLGDIIISYFKRISKVKDTGKIIPGHGGLLDRIDGMIFAYPFSYIMIMTTKIVIFQ
jgi:phosphatidate cytidylyltransferase